MCEEDKCGIETWIELNMFELDAMLKSVRTKQWLPPQQLV